MATNKRLKKTTTLIYGGGAIGSYLAACLLNSKHKIFFLCRKKNYKIIKSNGLLVELFDNSILKKKYELTNSNNFKVINNIYRVKKKSFDNIFITTKINQDLKKILQTLEPFISKKTLIITPCTSIPFWWYKCLNNKIQKKFENNLNYYYLKNLKRKNLVGMTMWLSGRIEKPGHVIISHIQRGFPIKEVFNEKRKQVNKLRNDLKKNTISPKVKNIFSEIFIKSINSLAFNMIALKYNQNNQQLSDNKKAIREVYKILREGDKILNHNNISTYQSINSRIKQTLKSKKHTMSMLYAYRNNKVIELNFLWKSFQNFIKILNLKMNFTEKVFKSVNKIINESL